MASRRSRRKHSRSKNGPAARFAARPAADSLTQLPELQVRRDRSRGRQDFAIQMVLGPPPSFSKHMSAGPAAAVILSESRAQLIAFATWRLWSVRGQARRIAPIE